MYTLSRLLSPLLSFGIPTKCVRRSMSSILGESNYFLSSSHLDPEKWPSTLLTSLPQVHRTSCTSSVKVSRGVSVHLERGTVNKF